MMARSQLENPTPSQGCHQRLPCSLPIAEPQKLLTPGGSAPKGSRENLQLPSKINHADEEGYGDLMNELGTMLASPREK